MSMRANAQIRRSQAITTWGPGALIDLPRAFRDRRRARDVAEGGCA